MTELSPHPSTKTGRLFNKSLVTNLVAILLTVVGFFLPEPWRGPVLNIGLFAFSGALTNWLAIHMLFEKVPGFYGSGVIPARFEEFKVGIHQLVMEQFFTQENVARFFESSKEDGKAGPDLSPLINTVDLDPSFEALKTAVMKSQFGSTLSMFGGAAALDPIKSDFEEEMRVSMKDIVSSKDFQKKLQALMTGGDSESGGTAHAELLNRVSVIVEKRLEELTPQLVKEIIQQMIHAHLGWLVVWGGVCGGLIGLVAGVLKAI